MKHNDTVVVLRYGPHWTKACGPIDQDDGNINQFATLMRTMGFQHTLVVERIDAKVVNTIRVAFPTCHSILLLDDAQYVSYDYEPLFRHQNEPLLTCGVRVDQVDTNAFGTIDTMLLPVEVLISRAGRPERSVPLGVKALGDTPADVFRQLASWHRQMRPCIFLDRDGIIIDDVEYPYRKEDFTLVPGIADLLRFIHDRKMWSVVLTNQAGIAKGHFTEAQFELGRGDLQAMLKDEGVEVDRWYHCPYHQDGSVEPYRRTSVLRKPQPGMVALALSDLPIDLSKSWMIGDRDSDELDLLELPTLFLNGKYPITPGRPKFETLAALLAHLKMHS